MNPFKLVIDYRLTDAAVQICTLGDFVIAAYPLRDVEAVHHGIVLFARHTYWLNRLDLWDSAVTLRLRSGRHLVLSPDLPEQFVATTRSLLRRQRSRV